MHIFVEITHVRTVVIGFKSLFLDKETNRVFRKLTKRNNIDYFVCAFPGCTAKLKSDVDSENFIAYGGKHIDTVEAVVDFVRVQEFNKLLKEWSNDSSFDHISAHDLYARAKEVFKEVELPHDHRSKQLTSIRQNRFKLRKNGLSNKCSSNDVTTTPHNIDKNEIPEEVIQSQNKSTSQRKTESERNSKNPEKNDGAKVAEFETPIAKFDSEMTPRRTRQSLRTISKAASRKSGKAEKPEELKCVQRGIKPEFYSESKKIACNYVRLEKVKRKLTYDE